MRLFFHAPPAAPPAAPQRVRIAVYNLLGQRVAVLQDGQLAAEADHAFQVEGAPLPAGGT